MKKKLLALLLALLLLFGAAFAQTWDVLVDGEFAMTDEISVEWGYDYFSPDEVALYLHAFEELPPNYITKKEAQSWGWYAGDDLWDTSYGYCIGGDKFGNREKMLPTARERQYYECDVNYYGGKRGAERLVFSNDGLIYYTADHYSTFDLLYEEWYWQDGWYRYDD